MILKLFNLKIQYFDLIGRKKIKKKDRSVHFYRHLLNGLTESEDLCLLVSSSFSEFFAHSKRVCCVHTYHFYLFLAISCFDVAFYAFMRTNSSGCSLAMVSLLMYVCECTYGKIPHTHIHISTAHTDLRKMNTNQHTNRNCTVHHILKKYEGKKIDRSNTNSSSISGPQ